MLISERLKGTRDYVVVDLSKLDGNENNDFRMKLQESGIQLMAVKNALARNALAKQDIEAPKEVFSGPCSIAFGSTDIVELSKEITKWAKQLEPLEIRGGAVDGQSIDAEGVKAWSKAKGREENNRRGRGSDHRSRWPGRRCPFGSWWNSRRTSQIQVGGRCPPRWCRRQCEPAIVGGSTTVQIAITQLHLTFLTLSPVGNFSTRHEPA